MVLIVASRGFRNVVSVNEGSQDYWVFGLRPSYGILKNIKNRTFWKLWPSDSGQL
jgi:hypothetical protein